MKLIETKAATKRTGYTYDERMLLHTDPEGDHPEQPARLREILKKLENSGLLLNCTHVPAGDLPNDALCAAHTPEHLQFVSDLSRIFFTFGSSYNAEFDVKTLIETAKGLDSIYLCPDSETSAAVAVECTTRIACEIAIGRLNNGFALVRPPGHHAESGQAMGFCLYNNVAVAVKELQRLGLAKKVMIVDWDVHHGNGTQEIFSADPEVLFISIHRYDEGKFYPNGLTGSPEYVGVEPALGYSVNVGWDGPGTTDSDYMAAFRNVVIPIADQFCPDFVIVSAGFDAAIGDPIGECKVSPRGFAEMTHQLMRYAGGKVLLVLEGGYNIPAVAGCVEACLRTLMGEPVPYIEQRSQVTVSKIAMEAINATIKAQSRYWTLLYPRHYDAPTGDNPFEVVNLQDVFNAYWSQLCVKTFHLIPLPIADPSLQSQYQETIYVSDNIFEKPKGIIVFSHESGLLYSKNVDSNIITLKSAKLHQPFYSYLREAIDAGWAVVDLQIMSHEWRLKQTDTGSPDELVLLNDIFLYLWDNFLALSESLNIFFVSSGLASYSVCHLIDKRILRDRVRGIAVISPTLYLPVASTERSDWYSKHSFIVVPTKRPVGSPVATSTSFGNCISSGSEDPAEIGGIITRFQSRIFNFINERAIKEENK